MMCAGHLVWLEEGRSLGADGGGQVIRCGWRRAGPSLQHSCIYHNIYIFLIVSKCLRMLRYLQTYTGP